MDIFANNLRTLKRFKTMTDIEDLCIDGKVVAGRCSKKVKVVKGKTYYWCQCGKSRKQPFCDGSHKGSGIRPIKFTATETKDVYLCMCKQTKKGPYCDGSHKKLPKKKAETETPDSRKGLARQVAIAVFIVAHVSLMWNRK